MATTLNDMVEYLLDEGYAKELAEDIADQLMKVEVDGE